MDCLAHLRTNLRRIRLKQGLTQAKAAEVAGIDYKYYQKIEGGLWPNLTLATLQKLAEALRVLPWELLCEVPERKAKGQKSQRVSKVAKARQKQATSSIIR